MRIFLCIGTRPEAIKMLPLAIELKKYEGFEVKICFSAQHSTLAKEVFDYYKIEPDICLRGLKKGDNLCEMTRKFLNYFDVVFEREAPDIVLVHGDTTTAFCASLVAFYKGIRIGHIEAGLRSFDAHSPFPEEFNRVAIDAMADYHFAPTLENVKNLAKEGKNNAFLVGNTVIDAINSSISKDYYSPFLQLCDGKKLLVITMHRRESLGDKMRGALLGIRDILDADDGLFAILPVHPNPLVREAVFDIFCNVKNIKICEPMPLYDFHNILSRAFAVLTDSGGIQEEACYLGVPVFLLRDRTERCEGEQSGNICILGTGRNEIFNGFFGVLENGERLSKMQKPSLIFGDGTACEKIAKILLSIS